MMISLLHEGHGSATGLLAGLLHPITGADHVLAMVAVGLWGAQLGRPAIWVLPVVFPVVMACGGCLALAGMPLPGVEIGIALSAVALGACVLLQLRPPLGVALALVAAFALFHGHAHGTELPPGDSGLTYSVGFVVATGALHGTGIGLGEMRRWPAGARTLRVLGAGVALGGCGFLWGAFA